MAAFPGPWALVLAAGDGSRLRALTTDGQGNSTPKQFCSLSGGSSLLGLALRRAARVVPSDRIVTIVAARHERWWRSELAGVPARNVIVQPGNRGTAIGVLLPLLSILSRDRRARIVLLPSDHFVADEELLARAVHAALNEVERRSDRVVMLGIVPDEPDPDLGWIVPAARRERGPTEILRFVEKPPAPVAGALMARGGLWNSFILASTGTTLLDLFETRLAAEVDALSEALWRDPDAADPVLALRGVYETLGSFDFSRDVLQGQEERLAVVRVPRCGWSDLGTPARVARCLELTPGLPGPRVSPEPIDVGAVEPVLANRLQAGAPTR